MKKTVVTFAGIVGFSALIGYVLGSKVYCPCSGLLIGSLIGFYVSVCNHRQF